MTVQAKNGSKIRGAQAKRNAQQLLKISTPSASGRML
jgi:hypothetical protein